MFEELKSSSLENLLIIEMLRDLKKILNPIYSLPEKIGIARAWMIFLCKSGSMCLEGDVDEEKINVLAEKIVEYIIRKTGV